VEYILFRTFVVSIPKSPPLSFQDSVPRLVLSIGDWEFLTYDYDTENPNFRQILIETVHILPVIITKITKHLFFIS
jgi:hypothetical protein